MMTIQNPKSQIQDLLSAIFIISALSLVGCNIVGPAAFIIEGTGSVEPEYVLADVPTVVFIDDRSNVVNPVSLRRVIGDTISGTLMEKEIVKTTISSQDAMNIARQSERNSRIMSLEEIGKAVGAKQVIYVKMVQFQDTPDNFTPRPFAACDVRVIDVESRTRVFPAADREHPSRPVQVMTREVDPSLYATRGGRLKVFEELAVKTGEEIAKLFYKHEARPLGTNLNPR